MGSIGDNSPANRVDNGYLSRSVQDLMSLAHRVVVVTGGARGIGLALAFAVAEVGASVAIIDAAAEPDPDFTLLQTKGVKARYYKSDVTDYATLQASMDSIVDDFGRIDGIITAAGVCGDQRFLERDPQSVKRCLEINSLGTYYSTQLAVAQMIRQPRLEGSVNTGSVVMIASISAHLASKSQFTSDYCMSKGAVLSLAKQLGVELAEHNVRVNCLSPGYIMTDMTALLIQRKPDLGKVFNEAPPMQRIGERADLKAATVYLLSDASAYMTGAEMLITGGMHAGRI